MLQTTNTPSPTLQAPGKGLPAFELFVARIIVGLKSRLTSRAQADALFEFEKREILRLARSTDPVLGCKQVLIKRPRGLEDSSRYWSVFMTLDHLRIVNQGTTGLITTLANGGTPSRVVSTADVKPSPQADAGVIQEFEAACNKFQEVARSFASLKTSQTWPHPWFGPLNAEKWHFFAGFHMNLHRIQILAIRRRLELMARE